MECALIKSGHKKFVAIEEEMGIDTLPPAIGTRERRLQVRAYNYWVGLLDDRNFPHIDNLTLESLPEFGPCSVILKFPNGPQNPELAFIGEKLVEESETSMGSIRHMADIPEGSLVARIVEHYPQLLENEAPTGFEAEFASPRGCTILYRGILLPFSSDGERVDYIFGVINWRELADVHLLEGIQNEIGSLFNGPSEPEWGSTASAAGAGWADGPSRLPSNNLISDATPYKAKAIAEYLRKLPAIQPGDCISEDEEFALALVRRDASGHSHVIGGVPDSGHLLEQAMRKLVL